MVTYDTAKVGEVNAKVDTIYMVENNIGKLLATCQSFLPQVYGIVDTHFPPLDHLPNITPTNSLNSQCFLLYTMWPLYEVTTK